MEEIHTIARTRRIGGSLVITIPAEVIKEQQIDENEIIEIKVRKRRIDGFGMLKGIGSYKREEDRMKDRI